MHIKDLLKLQKIIKTRPEIELYVLEYIDGDKFMKMEDIEELDDEVMIKCSYATISHSFFLIPYPSGDLFTVTGEPFTEQHIRIFRKPEISVQELLGTKETIMEITNEQSVYRVDLDAVKLHKDNVCVIVKGIGYVVVPSAFLNKPDILRKLGNVIADVIESDPERLKGSPNRG